MYKLVGYNINTKNGKEMINFSKGYGYLVDGKELLIPMVSKKENKPYIKAFDIQKCCKCQDGSHQGIVELPVTAKIPVKDSTGKDTGSFEEKTIWKTYYIWYIEK